MPVTLFIISSAAIFILERLWPLFFSYSIPLFPAFASFFIIRSRNISRDLIIVLATGLIFDAFSGMQFGWFSLVIAALAVIGAAVNKYISISQERGFLNIFFIWLSSVVSYLLFFAILKIPVSYMIAQLPRAAAEYIILIIGLSILFKK